VNYLLYLPEISRLISGSLDQAVRVWDRETFDCIHSLSIESDLSRRLLYLGEFLPFTAASSTVAPKLTTDEEQDDDESIISSNEGDLEGSGVESSPTDHHEEGKSNQTPSGKLSQPKIRPPLSSSVPIKPAKKEVKKDVKEEK
jgi:WD40 repeat protein